MKGSPPQPSPLRYERQQHEAAARRAEEEKAEAVRQEKLVAEVRVEAAALAEGIEAEREAWVGQRDMLGTHHLTRTHILMQPLTSTHTCPC